MSDRVLILGASARAAAASARRAGLTPFAVDLFADRDTRVLCEYVERCPLADYPQGLFDRAGRLPPMPWLYTGGLENYPELVGGLAAERELWGNGPDVLRRVRDPVFLERCNHIGGFADTYRPPAEGGCWPARMLRKPRRGSGGGGIRVARPEDTAHPDFYFQEYIPGEPLAVVFRAVPVPQLLGLSAQLVGTAWLHAPTFGYAGSVTLPPERNPVYGWPMAVCESSGLCGLFGVDYFAATEDREPKVVDLNPRYTASVEVHEFATGTALLRRTGPPPLATKIVGKAIYYAAQPLTIPASGPWDAALAHCGDVWRRPDFADIPHPGEVIEPGQPVVTLLADGPTEAAVVATLKARAAELDRLFGVPTPEDSP